MYIGTVMGMAFDRTVPLMIRCLCELNAIYREVKSETEVHSDNPGHLKCLSKLKKVSIEP